jgi:hypothetical protein
VPGLSGVEEIHFVDNQLWAPNVNPTTCSTAASSMVEISFDSDGGTSTTTSSLSGFVAADRGMLWVPSTRDLFESHCDPTDTIAHYAVGGDGSLTGMPTISGNGLLNPHGMTMTSWGELFVSNAGVSGNNGTTVLRFTFDGSGNPTANGTIAGNGLSTPIGQAFTPWGELLVVNQGNGSISRFTFDAAHAAVPNGNPSISGPSVTLQGGLGWILVVAGDSTNLLDAGAADAASD